MKGMLSPDTSMSKEKRYQYLFFLMVLLVVLISIAGPMAAKPVYFAGGMLVLIVLLILSLDLEACVLGFAFLLPCVPRSLYTPKLPMLPVGIDLIRAYLPFLILALFIRWLLRKPIRIMHHPAQKWMILWLVMYCIAVPRTMDMREAILQRIIPTLAAVLSYYLFMIYAREVRHIKRLMLVLISASGIVVFFAILEVVMGRSMFWSEVQTRAGRIRVASTLENAQVLGSFLLICAPIAGFYFQRSKGFLNRSASLTMVVLYVGTILLTLTRSAWLGIIMIGALLVKNKKSFFLLILVAVVFYFSPLFTEYVEPTLQSHLARGNLYHRIYVFKKAFHITKDHPFLGIGMNNFVTYSLEYDAQFIGTKRYMNNPGTHNTYFTFMAELGIPGIIGFLGMVLITLKGLFRLYRRHKNFGEVGIIGHTLFISLMAVMATGLTYQAFQWGTLITPFLLLLGAGQVVDKLAEQQKITADSKPESIDE